jgi:hypothetical protein
MATRNSGRKGGNRPPTHPNASGSPPLAPTDPANSTLDAVDFICREIRSLMVQAKRTRNRLEKLFLLSATLANAIERENQKRGQP